VTLVPSPAPTRTAVLGPVTEPAASEAPSIVADAVSVRRRYGSAVFPAGPETKAAVTVAESPVAPRYDNVATADVAVYVSAVV